MVLYTEQDFAAAKREYAKRILGLFLIIAAIVGLEALFLTALRNRYVAWVIGAVGCSLTYAYLTLKLMPWYYYWAYQNDMRHGLSREMDAWYISCSDGTRLSDGVAFHEMMVRIGDGEEDERMFLWDADKKKPEIKEGQKVHIRSYGNYVTELHIVE